MAFQFPWTNFHELNLDWFLSKFKQFTNNYLGTTATAESVPYGTQPTVTVTGGELDDDTDIVDPFTFNFKIPAGQQGEQGEQGVPGTPGQDGFSPIATVTKSGTVATITITDANGTTTATISDGEVTQAQLDTKAPAIMPTASGSITNFSDGADNLPMSELIASITPSQSGSGDPSPSNIRPISGWTGCNVTRAGKNLFDSSVFLTASGWTETDGVYSGSSTSIQYSIIGYLLELSNLTEQITLSFKGYVDYADSRAGYFRIYYSDGTTSNVELIDQTWKNYSLTSTAGKVVVGIGFLRSNSRDISITDFQVEIGSSASAYEPYHYTSLTVDWTTEAGTVYGGTLDVKTGMMTVTDANIASYAGETLPSTWISDRDVYTEGATPTTGAQVVYKLATPQTYQLTPQQLFNTLYGGNNVWCNTGDSTVTYTADTMLYIQNLTQPTEDDMVANTAIANGKFFMIGNNLYRATTAIASGSQIIPGTNATPMSLADALNLL